MTLSVDALSGVEIQSRYRTACRSDSHKPEDDKLAEALTHWLFYIQEHQDLPYKESLKFRDSLICGIGWSHLCKEDGAYYYDYVHPLYVIPTKCFRNSRGGVLKNTIICGISPMRLFGAPAKCKIWPVFIWKLWLIYGQ